MRNRKVLFLFIGTVIGFFYSRVCIAATQPRERQAVARASISENYLDGAITGGDLRIVRAALERGYSVNDRLGNIDSPTLLIEAAGWGHPSIVQFLLTQGADVNAHTTSGETALWQAAAAALGDDTELGWETVQANYVKVIHLLIKDGANPNIPNNNGVTPLGIACYRNRIDGVKALLDSHPNLNHRDDFGKTPIEWLPITTIRK